MGDKKEFIATLETRTSKKGNQYDVLKTCFFGAIRNRAFKTYCRKRK